MALMVELYDDCHVVDECEARTLSEAAEKAAEMIERSQGYPDRVVISGDEE